MTDRPDPTLIEEAEFMDRAALAALANLATMGDGQSGFDAVDWAVGYAHALLVERRKWRKEMGL